MTEDEKALLYAVEDSDLAVVKNLLDKGVNVNLRDTRGINPKLTPLHLAAAFGAENIVKILIEFGANPDLEDDLERVPLHLAVLIGRIEAVELLLKVTSDLYIADVFKSPNLSWALKNLEDENVGRIIELLKQGDANK